MSHATRLNTRITQLAVGRHLPYRTVRVRLTLLYGVLFLLSGAALMAIAYALLVNAGFVFTLQNGTTTQPSTGPAPSVQGGNPSFGSWPVGFPGPGSRTHPSATTMAYWSGVAHCMRDHGVSQFPDPTNSAPSNLSRLGEVSDRDGAILVFPATLNMQSQPFTHAAAACGFMSDSSEQTAHDDRRRTQVRQELVIQSGIALAAMSLLSLGLGWLMAGRVLQPLADSFQAQRQFVANASHELRAPLTRQRALIQVALADPGADVAALRAAHERVLASEQDLEQIIDGLLTLTRGQAGLERREHLDLADLTARLILARESQLGDLGIEMRATLARAPTAGDPRLLECLVANLIDNAIRHNISGGHVEVATGVRDRHAFVSIANTGPTVPPEQIERLFRPFERLGGARTSRTSGHGLGLSIVEAIITAHGAAITAGARPDGGLTIEVSFPPLGGAGKRVTKGMRRYEQEIA
jgi:signal transduction histidine kinase